VKLVEAEEEDRGSKTLELFTLLLGGIGKNSRVGCRCKRGERERVYHDLNKRRKKSSLFSIRNFDF